MKRIEAWWIYDDRTGTRTCRVCGKVMKRSVGIPIKMHQEKHMKGGEQPKNIMGRADQKYISLKTVQAMIAAGALPGVKNAEEFMEKYTQHKGSWGGSNRLAQYNAEMGEDEMALLKDYFNGEIQVQQIQEKWNMTVGIFYHKVQKAAIHYLYLHRKELGFVESEGRENE